MPKPNIHPALKVVAIECACGQIYHTRSTRDSYKIDICAKCHPYYTGKAKFVDAEGRMERFYRKYGRR